MVNVDGHCGERWGMVRDDAWQGVCIIKIMYGVMMYGGDGVWWG